MKKAQDYSNLQNMPRKGDIARYLPLNNTKYYSTFDLTHTIQFDVKTLPIHMQCWHTVKTKNLTVFHLSNIIYNTVTFAWILAKLNNKQNLLDTFSPGQQVLYIPKNLLNDIIKLF